MTPDSATAWIPPYPRPGRPGYDLGLGVLHLGTESLPLVCLKPADEQAGLEDLTGRCGWRHMAWPRLPVIEGDWRLILDPARQAVARLVHVDFAGRADVVVWEAGRLEPVDDDWWWLLDRVEYAMAAGPATEPAGDWIIGRDRGHPIAAVLARATTTDPG